jgi:UDP-N-acetylglucosamine 2-epimerase (non-hydrolysing)/GDP/UDP-N,N'-diacetylbacillosamine 2-epimerase (hydrolysing)
LSEVSGQLLFCYPNADAGSRALIERTRAFLGARGNGRVFVNLDAITYWSLLRQAKVLVGNSSSGIMETASFAIPTVNIGIRQQGREHAKNVVDARAESSAILAAIAAVCRPEFRAALQGMSNPYGDGVASDKIAEILATVPLGPKLLMKRAVPLNEESFFGVANDRP